MGLRDFFNRFVSQLQYRGELQGELDYDTLYDLYGDMTHMPPELVEEMKEETRQYNEGLRETGAFDHVAKKPATEEATKALPPVTDDYECVYTTFQQFHLFSSYTDILYNDIRASARDIVLNAAAIYTLGGAAKVSPVVYADWTIRADLQKTDLVDSGTVQNLIGPDGVYSVLGVVPGEDTALTYAQSYVVEKLRDMYKGELIVRGAPAVKPYDFFYLNDSYTQMHGLAEVGRVVHSISPETGFISSIKPDLISRHRETAELDQWTKLCGGLLSVGLYGALRAVRFGVTVRTKGSAYLAAKATMLAQKAENALGKLEKVKGISQLATKVRTGMRGVGGVLRAAGAAAAPLTAGVSGFLGAAAALAVEAVVAGLINNLARKVSVFRSTRDVARIYPMFLKDKPYVAGITGAKHLIAYGEYEEVMSGDTGSAGATEVDTVTGSPGQRALPDGRFLGPPSDRMGAITSRFGELRSPPRYSYTYKHKGIDMAFYPDDAPILALQAGTVSRVSFDPEGYGNYVVIDHGSGTETLYAHLSSVSVGTGQRVKAGDVIGRQGSTGRATGPHLHLELRINGAEIDPLPYLPPASYQG